MTALRFNHVSISASDVEESARFFESVFGLRRLPAPRFSTPVIWFQIGEGQLHVFEREGAAPQYHHLGIEVDDFETVYKRVEELGLFDDTWGNSVVELPSGEVQMYLRDPGGNLIEIDHPDIATLDRTVVTRVTKLASVIEQGPEACSATLFHRFKVGS